MFQASDASAAGEDLEIAELFWSRSARSVVRGLHFQVPPYAHSKLVTIVSGTALDVVVDLRRGSPAYGEYCTVPFDAAAPVAVFIPIGCAHGFQATSDDATIIYTTTTEHAPDKDRGIRWDSIGIDWPIAPVVVSDRDAAFPSLTAFDSPFYYSQTP